MPSPLVDRSSLRRVRLIALAPRWAFVAVAFVLGVAGLKSIVRGEPAPARVVSPHAEQPAQHIDVTGFAEAFARAYLSYDAADPEARAIALASFVAGELDEQASTGLPLAGRRTVT